MIEGCDGTVARSARLTLVRWPAEAPEPPAGGRSWTVLDLASSGSTASAWLEALRRRKVEVESVRMDEISVSLADGSTGTEAIFAGRAVGWRLAVVGPEHLVLAVRAAALDFGMIDEELLVHAESRPRARAYCAHCTTTFETALQGPFEAPVAATSEPEPRVALRCPGCGLRLRLHRHVARLSGRYLASVDGVAEPAAGDR